jgi:hypothetical protein
MTISFRGLRRAVIRDAKGGPRVDHLPAAVGADDAELVRLVRGVDQLDPDRVRANVLVYGGSFIR